MATPTLVGFVSDETAEFLGGLAPVETETPAPEEIIDAGLDPDPEFSTPASAEATLMTGKEEVPGERELIMFLIALALVSFVIFKVRP